MRWFAGLLALFLGTLLGLAGCQPDRSASPDASDASLSRSDVSGSGPTAIRYVTTIPPFAMILAPVVGTRGSVTALLAPGDSPHTYDLRPSDVRRVERSAAMFYGAPALDAWAGDLPRVRSIALLPLVPPARQRTFDAASEGHPPAHASHSHAGGPDPHFWTDPQAVRALLPALADTLCAVDAPGCATYRANADSFATALSALDAHLATVLRPVRDVPVMLAQPFFRYFLLRYGPSLVGVVAPTPAHEPSPRALHRLTQTAKAHGVQAIFAQASLPPRAARAVSEAAAVPIHMLDPLGGTNGRTTYDALLTWNAQRIRDALSAAASGSDTPTPDTPTPDTPTPDTPTPDTLTLGSPETE